MSKVGEVGMEGKVGKVGKVREVGMGGRVGKRRAAIGVSRKHFFLSGRLLDRGAIYLQQYRSNPVGLGCVNIGVRKLPNFPFFEKKKKNSFGVRCSATAAPQAQRKEPREKKNGSALP